MKKKKVRNLEQERDKAALAHYKVEQERDEARAQVADLLAALRDVKIYKRENPGPFRKWLTTEPGRREMVIVLGPKPDTPETVAAKCKKAREIAELAVRILGK
jgi:hypothetical protein